MSKKIVINECKLCLKRKKLCKSHIIPAFLYESILDKDLRGFMKISDDPNISNKPRQIGETELLLCQKCENHISAFETYASNAFFKNRNLEIKIEEKGIIVTGLDYNKFKLFQLSLIWKMGVSSRPMFKAVDLHKHEEVMRKMLFNSDPGMPHLYACLMTVSLKCRELLYNMCPPEQGKLDPFGVRIIGYITVFSGFMWKFLVSSHTHKLPTDTKNSILRENGEMFIGINDEEIRNHITERLKRLAKLGKFDEAMKYYESKSKLLTISWKEIKNKNDISSKEFLERMHDSAWSVASKPFLGKYNGSEVVYLCLDLHETNLWIYEIFVHPDYRRKGIFTATLQKVEELGREWNYKKVFAKVRTLDDNITQEELFQKYFKKGFRKSKTGEDCMEKDI